MEHRKGEAPQRSCLACRATRKKGELLRFVVSPDNEVVPDLDARLPGRGGYTCLNRQCLIKAVEQRQFRRAFKRDVTILPAEQLAEHITWQLVSRITGLVGLANKAGCVISGSSLVEDALRSHKKPYLVIVAEDVSPAIGDKIKAGAEFHKVPCRTAVTKEVMGDVLGKAPRSAVAVTGKGFVEQLIKNIDRYRNFLGEV